MNWPADWTMPLQAGGGFGEELAEAPGAGAGLVGEGSEAVTEPPARRVK